LMRRPRRPIPQCSCPSLRLLSSPPFSP
jgi:hypothetical protein